MKKIFTILFTGILLSSFGHTFTWTAAGDGTSWSNSGNWNDGGEGADGLPDSDDDVIVNFVGGDYLYITTNVSCNSILFSEDAGIYINDGVSTSGVSLTVLGDIDFNLTASELSLGNLDGLKIAGNFLNRDNAVLTITSLYDAASFVEYNGSVTQDVWGVTYGKLILSGSGNKTIDENITIESRGVSGGTGRTCLVATTSGTITFGLAQITTFTINSGANDGTGTVSAKNLRKFQDVPALNYTSISFTGTRATSLITFTSGSTTKISGDLIFNSTFSGAGKPVLTGSTLEFNSQLNTQAIPLTYKTNGNIPYNNLTLSGSGVKTISGNLASLVAGTLTLSGSSKPSVSYVGTTQTIIAGDYDVLSVSGTGTKTITGTVTTISGGISVSTSTVSYNGSAPQTVLDGTYISLLLSGAGQKNISGNVTAATINGNTSYISISGSLTVTTFNKGTSTVDYSASGDQTVLSSIGYYNLAVSGSGNKTVGSALSVNNLTTSGTAVLVTGTNNITVSGNFTNGGEITKTSGSLIVKGNYVNNGTSTLGDGILLFNGSLASILSGSAALTARYVQIAKTSNSLTLTSTLNISSNGTFKFNNATSTLNSGGFLTLKATGSSTYATIPAIPTGSTITGNVTSEAFINSGSGRFWWHLASPMASVQVSSIQDDILISGTFTGNNNATLGASNAPSMYSYNESTKAWVNYPVSANTETILAGDGYRLFIRDSKTTSSNKTLDLTGAVTVGAKDVNLSYTNTGDAANDGWNFIGNPYPSSITWSRSDADLAIDNNAYVWNAASAAYETPTTIAAFQGFWVQADNGGDSKYNFTESMKTNVNATLKRPTVVNNLIEIVLNDKIDGVYSKTTSAELILNEQGTLGFDSEFDRSFLSRNFGSALGEEKLTGLASLTSGRKMSTNAIPLSENEINVPLYMEYSSDTKYRIDITSKDFDYPVIMTLVDNYLDSETTFEDSLNYNFTISNSDASSKTSDRFTVRIGARPVGLFEGESSSESNIELYPNPTEDKVSLMIKSIYSDFEISVVDLIGNEVFNEFVVNTASSVSKELSLASLQSGVYFVKITHKGNTFTEKVIVNKH